MARHHISEARVQEVINGLVDGFLDEGSVHKLAETLSSLTDQRIYPNRIHGLLAEDASRTITSATLDVLELGLGARVAGLDGADRRRDVQQKVLIGAASVPADTEAVPNVAAALDLPPAVVRRLMPGAPAAVEHNRKARHGTPDWSWQNHAVKNVLEDLRRAPSVRVGLIVPTGGGKTQVGLRCALERLSADPEPDSAVLWVTHRRRLRTQARRNLQRLMTTGGDAPDNAGALFDRIRFIMVGDLVGQLADLGDRVNLLVVDEAHHAAAPNYAPILQSGVPSLFLTATPVRADSLPIGIDTVAYTTTYRDLFERRCVIEPTFDPTLDLIGLTWSTSDGLRELADYLLDRTEQDFTKVLVAVSRTDHTERLYEAVLDLLDQRPGHRLTADDVTYVHGASNSFGHASVDDALDESAGKPSGILVATSQLVGEGYDDRSIDAVVVTYPSTSVAHLMQVAGRALRWSEDKQTAHVVQVRESSLQYYVDQRWLYQDISDERRPDLVDINYSSGEDLRSKIDQVLVEHHVAESVIDRVRSQVASRTAGSDVRVMLSGIPYYGPLAEFSSDAVWNAIFVDGDEWSRFLNVFNDLSLRNEDIRESHRYLQRYLVPASGTGSLWKSYMDLVQATEYARREIARERYPGSTSRPYQPAHNTTWLRYVTFRYRPQVPMALEAFLGDAINRDAVLVNYEGDPQGWAAAVKVALPLAGSIAYLLRDDQKAWLVEAREQLIRTITATPPAESINTLHQWKQTIPALPLPVTVMEHLQQLLRSSDWEAQYFDLR